jgi:hypothetical protein
LPAFIDVNYLHRDQSFRAIFDGDLSRLVNEMIQANAISQDRPSNHR